MTYFIISFVVIILLVVVMSLILKNAVKQVDEKSKSYFVDKLKDINKLCYQTNIDVSGKYIDKEIDKL